MGSKVGWVGAAGTQTVVWGQAPPHSNQASELGAGFPPEIRCLGKGRPALDTRLLDLELFDMESWGLELRCLKETRGQALQAPLLLQPDNPSVTRA